MATIDYRESSRKGWANEEEDLKSHECIQLGAILRIADAIELMAKDREKLESDLKWYRERYHQSREENHKLIARINSLKGWITRLKKQLNSK